MSLGNTKLVEYGIQDEESDLRVHVCPLAKSVYVFPTQSGVLAIEKGLYRKISVRTKGIITAEGYLVPPDDIEGCRCVELRDVTWKSLNLNENMNTTTKGKKAVSLVKAMIENGYFPVEMLGVEIDDMKLQIKGIDIIVTANIEKRIQVKCDFRGGGIKGENGCTGNLFLQVAECNPFKNY